MKKIITSVVAVVLLFTMVLTMASCFSFNNLGFGSVDMADLKSELEDYAEGNDKVTVNYAEGKDETGSKALAKIYTIVHEDLGRLSVMEFANKDLAKLYVKQYNLNAEYEESDKEEKFEKEEYELAKKWNELLVEIGEETEEVEEPQETICTRKGNVVIYGNKALADEFDEL